MRSKEIFAFLLFAFSPCLCEINKQMAGPFDIIIRYVESCLKNPGPNTINLDIKPRKINRTTLAMNGTLYLGIPFDDNLSAKVRLDQFTNGGWKENYFLQDFKHACSSVKKYANKGMKYILEAIHFEHKSCPIPKGNYTFHNVILAIDISEFPIFFYNKYRYYCYLKMKGTTVACIASEVDIVPKRLKKKG